MLHELTKVISITVPEYIREIKLSNAQRPKYFEWNGKTIKSKNKKLWKKCIDPDKFDFDAYKKGIVLPNQLHKDYLLI